jgi:ligand-binding sensor domain-containing protein
MFGVACPAAGMPADAGFPARKTSRYTAVNWWVKDGLPFDQVRDILQRRNGFLWVATRNGAARFDGVRFETFNTRNVPQMAGSSVRSLFEDRQDGLWFGHDSGEITVLIRQIFFSVPLPDDWPKVPIIGFVEDEDGTVWVMNRLGDRLPVTGLQSGRKIRKRQHMKTVAAGRNRIIAVTKDRIIDFTAADMREGIPTAGNYGRAQGFPGSDGSLWIVSEGRLRRRHAGRWTEDLGEIPWNNPRGTVLTETGDGTVFAGTPEDGVFVFDRRGGVERLTRGDGLGNNQVLCLYEDREHTVWAGTAAGLTAIRPRRVEVISAAPGREWAPHSVAPRRDGGIWVGTDGNGLFSFDGQTIRRMEVPDAAPVVHAVLEDRHGAVWLNARQRFLCRTQFPVPARSEAFQAEDLIAALYEETGRTVWAGGQHDLWRWNGKTWQGTLSEYHDISDIRCITGDGNGTLWIGTASRGLGRLAGGQFQLFGNIDGLPGEYINTLSYDPDDGTLWIGTGGGGLAVLERGAFACAGRPARPSVDDHQPGIFHCR